MKKRVSSGRREDLLSACIAYILENGIADLSLRPLAAQVGSKARLLIYHFGSKDALLAEAMTVVRARVQKAFAEIVDSERQRKPSDIIRTFWSWATSMQHQKFLCLFFEIHGLALQRPEQYGPYLEKAVSSWVELMVQVLPERLSLARRRALATLAVTTAIGLLLDYLSSGDKKRVTEALDLFADSFDGSLAMA
jgi:AcrR family transcriptional regulator